MSKEKVGFGANRVIISLPPAEWPISVEWAVNLASHYWPLNISREFCSQEGMGDDQDVLHNYTAGYALATRARYIWFLSNEILPPNWAISKMLEAMRVDPKIMVISGSTDEAVDYLDQSEKETSVIELPKEEYVSLECTLVKTELFKDFSEPWFESNSLVSSASRFCHNVREAGYKVCAHPGVICGYVDMKTGKSHWPSSSTLKQAV